MRVEDIQYVLDELGGGNYRRSGDHLMSSCPLAPWTHDSGQDRNPSFGVLVTEGIAPCNCFHPGCFPFDGQSGTLLNLVKEVGRRMVRDGLMEQEKLDDLIAFVLLAEDEEVEDDWGKNVEVLPIPPEIMEALGTGSPYWRSRGVTEEAERAWRLGEAGGRALIPFMNRMGEVIAVQGRLLPSESRDDYAFDRLSGRRGHAEKYRSWPVGFDRENHLAGEHLLKKPVDFLVVVESPNDALLLNSWMQEWWEAGKYDVFPYGQATDGFAAVSTMGGEVAKGQVQKLVEGVSPDGELAIGFDNDNAGRLGTKKLTDALKRRLPLVTVVRWQRKDPSDRGDPSDPISLDQLKDEAYRALAARQDWFSLALSKAIKPRA